LQTGLNKNDYQNISTVPVTRTTIILSHFFVFKCRLVKAFIEKAS